MYGANKSLCQLIVELREHYNINPIILLRLRGTICDFLDKHKIEYIISHYYWWVYEREGLIERSHNIVKQLRNLSRIKTIIKKINNVKIDLVYTNSITTNIGVFLSRKLNCPHIWHIRESLEQFHFKISLGKYFAKRHFFDGAEYYIVISEYLIRSYNSLLPNHKVRRVYNGISLENTKRQSNKFVNIFNLCIVGILSENKNQLDAIRAINILVLNKGIRNIHLHIIGGAKKEYSKILQDYIATNKLSEFVTLHGHQANVDSLLSNMNLGIMCSRDEAFGRVTIEYMLNRIPVIASNSGANTELIECGKNGEIYELYNAEDLAARIIPFIEKPFLLEKLGSYAQEYAATHFSSKNNTDSIYQIINNSISD